MKLHLVLLFSIYTVCSFAQFGPIENLNNPINRIFNQYTDVNGDGADDIVSLSKTKGQLVWIENIDGAGDFQDVEILSTKENIKSFVAEDFDGDGDGDIIILTEENEIVYLANNGQQIFYTDILDDGLEANCNMTWEATDIDNDGLIDLVVSGNCYSGLAWYKNLGNGFSEYISIDGYNVSYTLYTYDFDSDGDIDIFGRRSDKFYYFENLDGNGNFSGAIESPSGISGLRGFNIFDLNTDGFPDILYATSGNPDHIVWRQNNGDGSFAPIVEIYENNQPRYSTAMDMDNDGDLDIIASFYEGNSLKWFENIDGLGTFSDPITISSNIEYFRMQPSDINSDGKQDIFVSSFFNELVGWLKNENDQGTFSGVKPVSVSGSLTNTLIGVSPYCAVANLDGEPGMDILYNSPFGMTFLRNLDGKTNYSTYNKVREDSPNARIINSADLNGDGYIDILAIDTIQIADTGGSLGNKLVWYQNDGQANYLPRNIINPDQYKFLTMGDIDQDGDIDILAMLSTLTDYIYLFENTDGLGSFSEPQELIEISFPKSIFLEDINGDSFPDLIINRDSPTEIVWYENLVGTNTFNETANVIVPSNTSYEDNFTTGDFDNDGDIDIVYMNSNKDFLLYENIDGLGNYVEGITIVEDASSPDFFLFHDVNSDNHLDFIYANGSKIIYHVQEATGIFSDPIEWGDHGNADFIRFADIDGDGDQDLISENYDDLVLRKNILSNSVIMGSVYWDENENGYKDNSEIDLYLQTVHIEPSAIYEFTNPTGNFQFPVEEGQHLLTCLPSEGWGFIDTSDSFIVITTQSNYDTIIHNFGLIPTDSLIQFTGDLSSAQTRCGFTVPFWLNYENQSPLFVDGQIVLTIDSLLIENDTINFEEVLPIPDSIVGLNVYWHFDTLSPTQQDQIKFSIVMPGAEYLGEYINIAMNVEYNPSINAALIDTFSHIYTSQINCSYDPNDKIVEPSFENYDNYTLYSNNIYYTIRFQNTGTDTAFTIRIEDQLSPNLDFSSFKPVSASHDYIAQINDDGKVIFTFENILLPTETENQIASKGFVKFFILPKEDVPLQTEIQNTADIFFDFNPPIITNTVTNVLVEEYPIFYDATPPLCYNGEDGLISILFPPSSFEFLWENGETESEINNLTENDYTIEIFNISGTLVATTTIEIEEPQQIFYSISTTPASVGNSNGSAYVQVTGGTPPYTYNWETTPPQTSNTVVNLPAGTYNVTITDNNNCFVVDSCSIETVVSNINLEEEWEFEITPNPSNGKFIVHFNFENPKRWSLELKSIIGQTYKKYNAPTGGTKEEDIFIEGLESGVYFVTLTVNNNFVAKKIVITND